MRIKQNKERMSGKRFAGLLFGRLPITLFLILIEIFWMISFGLWLSRYAAWINTFFKLVSLAVVAFLVLKDENQSYKLTWIIVVALLPLFGGMMYLMFGNKRPSRRMRHQLEEIEALHRNLMTQQTPTLLSE
ncbi:MAG: PLDc_N domain-containing protein, partial [Clostridia bacterium]|nr:PLDc_N domain-containing protein [Clostridia bacterium]